MHSRPSLDNLRGDLFGGTPTQVSGPTGPVSFGAAKGIAHWIAVSDDTAVLILDLGQVPYVDTSADFALADVIEKAQDQDCEVLVCGIQPTVQSTLEGLGVFDQVSATTRFVTPGQTIEQALTLTHLER